VVAQKLNLEREPEYGEGLPPRLQNAKLTPAEEDARLNIVAMRLLNNVKVTRNPSTYIIEITAQSANGSSAATIANTLAEVYLSNSVGLRTGTASRQLTWLQRRMDEIGNEVRATDATIASYRSAKGIVQGGTNLTITDQQVAPLATQLATAESAAAAATAQLRVARAQMAAGGLDAVGDVLRSGVVADLRRQRAEVLKNMSEVRTRYGPRHPETQRVEEQLATLDRQIDEEARRIMGGLASEASSAAARAESLRGSLNGVRGEQAKDIKAMVSVEALERDAEAKRTQYNKLAEAVQQLQQVTRNSIPQARIVEDAREPGSPATPKRPLLLAVSLVLSIILGAGTITGSELISSRVTTVDDVERKLGLKLLASVPTLGKQRSKINPAVYLVEKPMTYFGEAFRTVRSALISKAGSTGPRVIAILSSVPSEGKTTVALSLARTMGLAGDRVLLIDCDLRCSGLRLATDIDPSAGLYEVLKNQQPTDSVIVRDVVENVYLLPVAGTVFTPEDLFSGDMMVELVKKMRPFYDYIILDTPPLLGIADSRTLAGLADAALLVVRWNDTPVRAVKASLDLIEANNVPLLGIILSMVAKSSDVLGGAYYSRKYAKYYTSN
jgi:capsular exopolysaccharide synthesis family protein